VNINVGDLHLPSEDEGETTETGRVQ